MSAAVRTIELIQDVAPFLNYILIPAIVWGVKLSAKVDQLHSGFSHIQVIRSKIAVLESRTGGPIILSNDGDKGG